MADLFEMKERHLCQPNHSFTYQNPITGTGAATCQLIEPYWPKSDFVELF